MTPSRVTPSAISVVAIGRVMNSAEGFTARRSKNLYYRWSKDFLEAGKKRLAGDTARAATSDEVQELRREAKALKEAVADLTLENRVLKKRMARPVCKRFVRFDLSSLHQRIRPQDGVLAKMEIRAFRSS
jgi:transposase